jgi:hypothetical protein
MARPRYCLRLEGATRGQGGVSPKGWLSPSLRKPRRPTEGVCPEDPLPHPQYFSNGSHVSSPNGISATFIAPNSPENTTTLAKTGECFCIVTESQSCCDCETSSSRAKHSRTGSNNSSGPENPRVGGSIPSLAIFNTGNDLGSFRFGPNVSLRGHMVRYST